MMSTNVFCEESALLVKHWDATTDVVRAYDHLRGELASILHSVEKTLMASDWWSDGWAFVRYDNAQAYISNSRWRTNGGFAVWIGAERFAPQSVFGDDDPPILYVWVSGKRRGLAQRLSAMLEESDVDPDMGQIDHRPNAYVVRDTLNKCLPDELATYPDAIHSKIVAFLSHYATMLRRHDALIQDQIT
jgi:hypothetical protein